MTLPQAKFREIVFQLLYSGDLGVADDAEMVVLMMTELRVTRRAVLDALGKVHKILAISDQLDSEIRTASTEYDFDRIRSVERNVLRLGVYEILHDESIPPKVAIAEAVRLARKFSTAEAASFVNALLDFVYKKSEGQVEDTGALEQSVTELAESEDRAQEAIEQTENNTESAGEDLHKP